MNNDPTKIRYPFRLLTLLLALVGIFAVLGAFYILMSANNMWFRCDRRRRNSSSEELLLLDLSI